MCVENIIAAIEEEERILTELWVVLIIDEFYWSVELRDNPALED